MQPSNLEQRNTKQIIEGFVAHADKWSGCKGKRFFHNQAMFFGVSPEDHPEICYEVKITRKKERIVNANKKENADYHKKWFLFNTFNALACLFGWQNLEMHNGKLVLHDDMNDYTIELVRKAGLVWKE